MGFVVLGFQKKEKNGKRKLNQRCSPNFQFDALLKLGHFLFSGSNWAIACTSRHQCIIFPKLKIHTLDFRRNGVPVTSRQAEPFMFWKLTARASIQKKSEK